MNTASRQHVRALGALLLGVAVAGAPGLTYGQGGHFGGGSHFGGGGHAMGGFGGGHSGGGHAGGGHAGGGGHVSGYSGAHASPGYAGASHYGGARFAGPAPRYSAPHFAGTVHTAGHGAFATASALHAGGSRYVYPPGGGYAPIGWHPWGGGYWHGGFWPHVYFYPGFAWYLPILPFGYATFWWGGVPYYYWNNLYYTWSPPDNGYVVTDPPPVAGSDDSSGESSAAGAGAGSDVYLYPRNGQSDEQMQNDRYECHRWAVNQTGFDPTRSAQQSSGSVADYRRAMVACLDARGYSAR